MKIKLPNGTEAEGTLQEIETVLKDIGQLKETEKEEQQGIPTKKEEIITITDRYGQTREITKETKQRIINKYATRKRKSLAKELKMSISKLYLIANALGVSGKYNKKEKEKPTHYRKHRILTPTVIEEINNAIRAGKHYAEISKELKISTGTISNARKKGQTSQDYASRKHYKITQEQAEIIKANWHTKTLDQIAKESKVPRGSISDIS